VVAGGLLQQHRLAVLERKPREPQILIHPSFDDDAVELLLNELLGLLEDAEIEKALRPLLAALGDHLRIAIVGSDERKFARMLRRLASQPIGMRVPHAEHT